MPRKNYKSFIDSALNVFVEEWEDRRGHSVTKITDIPDYEEYEDEECLERIDDDTWRMMTSDD